MDDLEVILNPEKTSDIERQRNVEKMVFTTAVPEAGIWKKVVPALEKEPVKWIRQLEARLLNKLPFQVDFAESVLSLLDSSQADVRLEGAVMVRAMVTRFIAGKNHEAQKTFEEKLLGPVLTLMKREEIVSQHDVWMELYKALSNLNESERLNQAMIEVLPLGGDAGLILFAQYMNGKYVPEGLEPLLAGFKSATSDETLIHVLRALSMSLPKGGTPLGYPNTEPVIETLLAGLKGKSDNVRGEAAAALSTRAKSAKQGNSPMVMEDTVWDALFEIYARRIGVAFAKDKDKAGEAISILPTNQDRLVRIFALMQQVDDEMQKQSLVGLISNFKAQETREELLKLLRENFAGLRLEAQKTTIEAASGYLPDEEIEGELDKLLGGKGLHADVLAKLADKLFAPLPSLKTRLLYWLGLNEKTKRPLLEVFPLPMMHTRIIQAARRLSKDGDILAKLKTLEPLLMMNDAKVKIHETLKAFPND